MATVSEVDVPGEPRGASTALLEERFVARPPRAELPSRRVAARVSLPARILEIWRNRELLVFLVRKQLKVKYKGSVLGLIWSMLNPAIVLGVYYAVFKYFLKSAIPDFALFLFCGLLLWNMFSVALMGSSATIVANAGIVKKVSFPREILALSEVGTALVFFFFQSIVMLVFLVAFRYAPAWRYLPLVPFALLDLAVLTAAIAIFLSAVNVYMRDIEHLIAVLLQAWFWGVPIIYSYNTEYSLFKSHHLLFLARLYLLDPIAPLVLAFQRAIYGHVWVMVAGPPGGPKLVPYQVLAGYSYGFYLEMLGILLVASIVLLLGAMFIFSRIEGNFAEEL